MPSAARTHRFPLVQLEDGTYTTDLDGVLDSFGIAARMQFGK